MGFVRKTWKDRKVEFPGRRRIVPVPGQDKTFDVMRAEGKVTEEGCPYNSQTMNDLESRVAGGLDDMQRQVIGHDREVQLAVQKAEREASYAETAAQKAEASLRHAPKILPPTGSQDLSLPGYCRVSNLEELIPEGNYLIVTRDSAGEFWALYASDIAQTINSGELTTAGCHAKLTQQNHSLRAVDYAGNPVKLADLRFTLTGDENGMYFQSREKYLWLDDKMFGTQPSRLSVQITPEGTIRAYNKNPDRPFRTLNFNKASDPQSKYPDHVTDFWGGNTTDCERFPLYLYQELPWTWHVWDADQQQYVDTGVAATQPGATGPAGSDETGSTLQDYMKKTEYGGSAAGVVRDADKLGGKPSAAYASAKAVQTAQQTANTAKETAAAAQQAANLAKETAGAAQQTANAAKETAKTAQQTAAAAMPKTGGAFSGDVYAPSVTATKANGKNGAFLAPGQVVVYIGDTDDGSTSFDRVMIDGESGRFIFLEMKDGVPTVTDLYAKSFAAGTPADFHAYVDNNFGFGIWTRGHHTIGTSWQGETLCFVSVDHAEFRSGNTPEAPFIAVDALAFNQKSSRKYKHDILPMTDACAKKLLSLRPVSFVYNNDPTNKTTYGMIAEEVEKVDSTACSYADGSVDSIDYSKFVPQLIRLCQMQQEQIDELREKVDTIEKGKMTK